jgi:hypothetical protein
MSDIRTQLQKEHADYEDNKDKWQLYLDGYEGSGGFEDGSHLVQFTRETAARFSDRQDLAVYENYCRPVVDVYKGHLLKKGATRQYDNNPALKRFYDETSKNREQNIDEIISEAEQIALIFGFSYVVVDKSSQIAGTLLEEEEQNLRPYAYTLTPFDIIDWESDSSGEFEWVKIKEILVRAPNPLEDKEQVTRYRIWTRNTWELWEDDGENNSDPFLVDSGEHGLGRVPVVVVKNKKHSGNNTIVGVSEIADIVHVNKALYNRRSELINLMRDQALAILIYPHDVKQDEDGNVNIGTDRILTYDATSGGKPEFISPDAVPMDAYEKRIESLVDTIFALARLDYGNVVDKSPSGIAMAFKFEKTNQSLIDKGNSLARSEKEIADIVLKWEGIEGVTVSVEYPTNFALEDKTVAINNDMNVLDIDISETFNKEYKKSAARKLLPALPQDTFAVIDNEIDESMPIMDMIDGGEDEE